ncbi:MAG: hypothetical protein WBD20_22475, partial [Pirellulaceae bacterium]
YQDDQYVSDRGQRWKAILFVSLFVIVLLCSGLGGLVYFGVQRLAGPRTDMLPPERKSDAFASDASEYNASLKNFSTAQCPDTELCSFVEETLDNSLGGIEVPLNTELFIEAVDRSPWNTRPLGWLDRISLRRSVRLYTPVSDAVWEYYRVLEVRLGPSPEFAVADIVYYGDEGQAQSIQWYLAKDDGKWTIYDWQQLETGRRTSDEYAVNIRGSERIREGYYDAMIQVGRAYSSWTEGDAEQAKTTLRLAENVKMLAADRPSALLSIAYTWMGFGEYDEALRVLNSVPSPDKLWGVWPSVAVCHYSLGDYDAALAANQKAANQSPDHPNVMYMKMQIHDALDQDDLAADAAMKALRLCPQDSFVIDYAIGYQRPKDLPELLGVLKDLDSQQHWQSFIYNASSDVQWTKTLDENLSSGKRLPSGARDLIAGNVAWTDEKHELAATHFLAARQSAEEDYLREMAVENLVSLRADRDQYEQLLAESDDLPGLLAELFDQAMAYDLYADPQKLLEAIESHSDLPQPPTLKGLTGWCKFELEQYAAARTDFNASLVELEMLAKKSDGDDLQVDDDAASRIVDVKYFIVDCLLNEGQPIDALHRFPDDHAEQQHVGDFLMNSSDRELVRKFVDETENESSDFVQLQRLRLKARAAFSSGDAAKCDEYHLAALKLATTVYDQDEWYRVRQMVLQRAKELAWNRTWRPAVEIAMDVEEFDASGVHTDAFAREATRLFDAKLLGDCFGAMKQLRAKEQTFAMVLAHQAEMLKQQGDLEAAAKALQLCLAKTDADEEWLLKSRQRELANLFLQMKDLDAALPHLKANEEEVSAQATVELFNGNLDAVRQLLQTVKPAATVTSWLGESQNTRQLLHSKDLPGFDELIDAFPLQIQHQRAATAGTLYFDPKTKIDQAFLQHISNAAGYTFRWQDVAIDKKESPSGHAVVGKSDSATVLFQWSTDDYDVEKLPVEIRSAFAGPVTRLNIVLFDDQPHSTKRLFRLAEVACDEAMAFQWDDDLVVWFGDDLANQLSWEDRLPVPKNAVEASIYPSQDYEDEAAAPEALSFSQWQEVLDENGGEADVVVVINEGLFAELVPALLTEVQEDENQVCVVMKADSAMDPLVQSGKKYFCRAYSIRKANTK